MLLFNPVSGDVASNTVNLIAPFPLAPTRNMSLLAHGGKSTRAAAKKIVSSQVVILSRGYPSYQCGSANRNHS